MFKLPPLLRPTRRQAAAAFAVAAALLLLNDHFLVESVIVPSSSMVPTILPNERAFLRHFPSADLRRFDVVVVDSRAMGLRIAKRVIGLPGDRVRLEAGWRVVLNGEPLTYQPDPAAGGDVLTEAGDHPIRVAGYPDNAAAGAVTKFGATDLLLGPDEYYVLGDNRLASEDGRAFGPVRRHEIQGKLGPIWYSFDRGGPRVRTERLFQSVH